MIEDFRAEVQQYLNGNHPYPFGDFYAAVLANDLVGAFARADSTNKYKMMEYAAFLYNEMPSRRMNPKLDWWGSYEAVNNRIAFQREQHTKGEVNE